MESRPPSARPVSPAPYLSLRCRPHASRLVPRNGAQPASPLNRRVPPPAPSTPSQTFVLLPPGKHKFAPRSHVPQESLVRPPALSSFPALPAVLAAGGMGRQRASRTPRAIG